MKKRTKRRWHTSYLSFFLHGHNFLLTFSRQNSVNCHKKMILQQNIVKCDKTPYIVHIISPHFRFSSHFSCGEFFPHDNLSCGEFFHLIICHMDKFLHMTIFSPRAPPMLPVTNMRYAYMHIAHICAILSAF